jgi:hypothetical protein
MVNRHKGEHEVRPYEDRSPMKLSKLLVAVALALSPSLTFAAAAVPSGERMPLNLALGKTASASGAQGGNDPAHAVDGDPGTRWCAPGASAGY